MMIYGIVNLNTGICENSIVLNSAEEYAVSEHQTLVPGGRIGWTWDGTNWIEPSWNWTTEQKIGRARFIRDRYLKKYLDRMNPVRWNSLTAEQQQAWLEYRQALLDIPQQPGFPDNIEWPVQPPG